MREIRELEKQLFKAIDSSNLPKKDKYITLLKLAEAVDLGYKRGEPTCIDCYHLPVCQILYRARHELRDNQYLREDALDYYKRQADICDFYV